MPQLLIRGLDHATLARLRTYAQTAGLALPAAAVAMLTRGLDALEARTAGAHALHASRTPTERQEAAQRAARARWAKN